MLRVALVLLALLVAGCAQPAPAPALRHAAPEPEAAGAQAPPPAPPRPAPREAYNRTSYSYLQQPPAGARVEAFRLEDGHRALSVRFAFEPQTLPAACDGCRLVLVDPAGNATVSLTLDAGLLQQPVEKIFGVRAQPGEWRVRMEGAGDALASVSVYAT